MTPGEPEVVYTTSDPAAAEVVRVALEEEGIRCLLAGGQQGAFPGVIHEITLNVAAEDAERAREFIARHEGGDLPDG